MNNKSTHQDPKEWFLSNIWPSLKEVNDIFTRDAKKDGDDGLFFAEWWTIFFQESLCLFEQITLANSSVAFASTLRTLMEFGADVSFLARYPENITILRSRMDEFAESAEDFSYAGIAKEARQYEMFKFMDGKRNETSTKTQKRIDLAFGRDERKMYDYLSCFVHFNFIGNRIIINTRKDPQNMLVERVRLLSLYPTVLKLFVESLGKIIHSEDLINYNIEKIKQNIRSMEYTWRFEDLS